MFIHMSTWIAEKDSMKLRNQRRKIFPAMWQWRVITDADYIYAKEVWKEFGIQNLYVQNNTLLLADVLENFHNKFIEIYKLDLAFFLLASRLAWQLCLKKKKWTRITNEFWYTTNSRKSIWGGKRYPCIGRQNQTTNTWKNMTPTKNHHTSYARMSIVCTDGQCNNSCLLMVSNGEIKNSTSTKT